MVHDLTIDAEGAGIEAHVAVDRMTEVSSLTIAYDPRFSCFKACSPRDVPDYDGILVAF